MLSAKINGEKMYKRSELNSMWAQELIESREKPTPDLPSFGVKTFEPEYSAEETFSIQQSLNEIKNVISHERVKMLGSLSQAVWRPDLNLAEVTHKTGSYWATMGHTVDQKLFLYPEEALYLLEIGALEISFNGLPLSVQRAYFVMLKDPNDITIDKYRVYSHLSAIGYKLLRHSPENTVTKYEKQLDIHKLGIKLKKHGSSFNSKKRTSHGLDSSSEINKKIKLEKTLDFPVSYNEDSNVKEILRKMQIFESHIGTTTGNINFDYDVYLESSGKKVLKKSCIQLPNYRLIVHGSDVAMPNLTEICKLGNKFKDEVPIIHAVVFPDYIAFYEINSVNVPEAFD